MFFINTAQLLSPICCSLKSEGSPLVILLSAWMFKGVGGPRRCCVTRELTEWWQRSIELASSLHSSGQCRSVPFPWLPRDPPLQGAGRWGLWREQQRPCTFFSLTQDSLSRSVWSLDGQPRSVTSHSSVFSYTESDIFLKKRNRCTFLWAEVKLQFFFFLSFDLED